MKILTIRARSLQIKFSQNKSVPSRSFCESGEYRRLQDNYLNLSSDLEKFNDRWVSVKKITLQNLVDRIRGFAEELSVKCSMYK